MKENSAMRFIYFESDDTFYREDGFPFTRDEFFSMLAKNGMPIEVKTLPRGYENFYEFMDGRCISPWEELWEAVCSINLATIKKNNWKEDTHGIF